MPVTGHGLQYPNASNPVEVWTDIQALADTTETALDVYETWNSWTPVFTSGGFSSFGSGGTNEGHYQQIGKLVHAEFRIELGTSPTVTAGIMVITLPVAAYAWTGDAFVATLGAWTVRDDSAAVHFSGSIGVSGAGGTGMVFNGAWSGTVPNSRVADTIPMSAWQVGDVFSGNLQYRAA